MAEVEVDDTPINVKVDIGCSMAGLLPATLPGSESMACPEGDQINVGDPRRSFGEKTFVERVY